jgi:IS30 family transposase
MRRNSRRDGQYRPIEAHRWAVTRRARRHRRRIETDPHLCSLIAELLSQRWSPPQIARHLRRQFPHKRLCHESIYQAIYQPGVTTHPAAESRFTAAQSAADRT